LLLGGLFAAAAAIVASPVLRVHRTWSKAIATVVDVEQFKSGGETVRRVELRFRGAADRDWTATCPVFQSVSRFAKGSDIPILFDPRNPTSVRIHTFMELWLLPALVGSVGMLSVLVGLCLAISLS
nr:DUF3592 domain-containing protein [Planctomycetaceae bacterium]